MCLVLSYREIVLNVQAMGRKLLWETNEEQEEEFNELQALRLRSEL